MEAMTWADVFSDVTREWFASTFDAPTTVQRKGWPKLAEGGNALLVAPTGSGKTLAAFLWSIDRVFHLNPEDPPIGEFELAQLHGNGKISQIETKHSPLLFFCLHGTGSISSEGHSEAFKRGDAILIPALCKNCDVLLEEATLFAVSVPTPL